MTIEHMQKENFFKESKRIKKDADWLLENSSILKMLKRYGRINLTGGYKLDLMMNGDIDIHIHNPKIKKEQAVDAMNRFIRMDYFKAVLFYDFVKYKKDGFPKGYYVGLKKPFKGKTWKFDIWFLKSDKENEKSISAIIKKLDDDKRVTILRLKEWRNKLGLKIGGGDIYKEVIKKTRPLKAYKKILLKKI
jgi:hypothetical protein